MFLGRPYCSTVYCCGPWGLTAIYVSGDRWWRLLAIIYCDSVSFTELV